MKGLVVGLGMVAVALMALGLRGECGAGGGTG